MPKCEPQCLFGEQQKQISTPSPAASAVSCTDACMPACNPQCVFQQELLMGHRLSALSAPSPNQAQCSPVCMPSCSLPCIQELEARMSQIPAPLYIQPGDGPHCISPCKPACSPQCIDKHQGEIVNSVSIVSSSANVSPPQLEEKSTPPQEDPAPLPNPTIKPAEPHCMPACMPNCAPECIQEQELIASQRTAAPIPVFAELSPVPPLQPGFAQEHEIASELQIPEIPDSTADPIPYQSQPQCMPECMPDCEPRCILEHRVMTVQETPTTTTMPTLLSSELQCIPACMPNCTSECIEEQENLAQQADSSSSCIEACMPACDPQCILDKQQSFQAASNDPYPEISESVTPATQQKCIDACMPDCEPQCILEQQQIHKQAEPATSSVPIPENKHDLQEHTTDQDSTTSQSPISTMPFCMQECMPNCYPECIAQQLRLEGEKRAATPSPATVQPQTDLRNGTACEIPQYEQEQGLIANPPLRVEIILEEDFIQ
ncbi:unnamed protein product, partial [Strongylus vulgaris]